MAREKITIEFDATNALSALAAGRDALEQIRAKLALAGTAEVVVPEVASEPAVAPSDRPKLVWAEKVSATFVERVFWIADEITKLQKSAFDPNWLMACMAWESGESFSPSKKNMAGSGATGLIQFMPTTATDLAAWRSRKLGRTITLSAASLAKMTAEDQLTWVYWYFVMMIEAHGPITNLEDCYMAILWPAAIGDPVSSALWTKTGRPTTYRQNAGLDKNTDGTITKLEAANHVRDKLTKGLKYAA